MRYSRNNTYFAATIILLILLPFFLFFGCENPLMGGNSSPVLQGVVTIEGMDDASGVVVSAEKVTDGQTKSVQTMLDSGELSGAATKGIETTVTDENGAFEFSALEEGVYTISAEKNDTLGAVETDVIVTTKDVTQVDISLTATGSISGTVTIDGKTTGNGGTFAVVDGTSYVAVTKDDGSFLISKVPIGSYTVLYYHMDFAPQSQSATVSASTTTNLTTVNLVSTTGNLEGTVTLDGQTGSGLAGTSVSISGTNYTTVTADNGSFVLKDIPAGTCDVSFSHKGYADATQTGVTVTAATTSTLTTVDLVLGPEIIVQASFFDSYSGTYILSAINEENIINVWNIQNYAIKIKNGGESPLTIRDADTSDTTNIKIQNHTTASGLEPPNTSTEEPISLDETALSSLAYVLPPKTTADLLLNLGSGTFGNNYYATITIDSDDPYNEEFSFIVEYIC